jgi:hypothetical protein
VRLILSLVLQAGGGKELKKETQLGLSTKKADDFSKWYSELVVASELISYYDVSGCYILRPWAFSMWEVVQRWFDDNIKKLGVQVRNQHICHAILCYAVQTFISYAVM